MAEKNASSASGICNHALMESLRIILDATVAEGFGEIANLYAATYPDEDTMKSGVVVAGMPDGTAMGKPGVLIGVPLPDGGVVIAETTLALFLTAADALKARYGDPR